MFSKAFTEKFHDFIWPKHFCLLQVISLSHDSVVSCFTNVMTLLAYGFNEIGLSLHP